MALKLLDDKHYKAIELLLDGKKTQREIAKEVGVHYNTIANWQRDELFQKEFKTSIVTRTHGRLGELVDSMLETAISQGNAAMAKLLLTMNDMLTDRVAVDTKVTNGEVDYEALDAEIDAFNKRFDNE